MQGTALMTLALSHLGESPESASDYAGYSVSALNILLVECFDIENSIREAAGKEKLPEPPFLTDLDEDIPYDAQMLTACISYGLAAKLILEDDDYSKFNYFNGMYVQGQTRYKKAIEGPILDVYGGSEA